MMSLYVLDTDHVTLLRREHPEVTKHLLAVPAAEIAITINTVGEQFRGWFTLVRKGRDAARLARAYAGLNDVIDMATRVRILPFSRGAVEHDIELRKQFSHAGKQDLAIASITMEFDATPVTRNVQDCERLPNLNLEDWSIRE